MSIEIGKTFSLARHALAMEDDRWVYSEALLPKNALSSVVFVAYPLRRFYSLEQSEVIESGVVDILGAYSTLMQAYDRYSDTSEALPSLSEIRQDSVLSELVGEVVKQVDIAEMGMWQRRGLIKLINRSRYNLYQIEQKYSRRELSSSEAFKWKEATGGALLSSLVAIFNKCFYIDCVDLEHSAYWYGANIQLLDDMADVGPDILAKRQTPVASLLRERGEFGRVANHIHAGRKYSFGTLRKLAPETIFSVEQKRREYFNRVSPLFTLDGYHQIADTSLTPLIFSLYSAASRRVSH